MAEPDPVLHRRLHDLELEVAELKRDAAIDRGVHVFLWVLFTLLSASLLL
jgi:hypothetical protein